LARSLPVCKIQRGSRGFVVFLRVRIDRLALLEPSAWSGTL
jgi:hypothetical protein